MHLLRMLLEELSRDQFLLLVTLVASGGALFAGAFGAWLAAYLGGRGAAKRAIRRALALPAPPAGDARLAALAGAVDAMALEVERISEGQRFLVKVLSEQEAKQMQLPRVPVQGSITPH